MRCNDHDCPMCSHPPHSVAEAKRQRYHHEKAALKEAGLGLLFTLAAVSGFALVWLTLTCLLGG